MKRTVSDSSLTSNNQDIPKSWQWVLPVIDEAHLPHLGLPIRFDKTKEKWQRTIYDPKTKKFYDIKEKKLSKRDIDFIKSSVGKNPMPGAAAPAAVRYERFIDSKMLENEIVDDEGNILVPCIADGDYVSVQSIESDHMQAKEEIIRRQINLVDMLNDDPSFAEFIMSLDGMNKFFIKAQMPDELEEKYYGTLFF